MSTAKVVASRSGQNAGRTPTYEEVVERLVALIAEAEDLDAAGIRPESELLGDLGMDSLSVVELQMAVEEAFGVTLPDEVPRTVKDAAEAVLAALAP